MKLGSFAYVLLILMVGFFVRGLVPGVYASGSDCDTHTVTVSVPETYHIVGTLCQRAREHTDVVEILVSGATYGHTYFDFPYQSEKYSYVQNALRHGYATFNYDRLGIGASDHPQSSIVTTQVQADILHQLIQSLRNGPLGHFKKVVVVGHSFGSIISYYEASQYNNDADALILTGLLHSSNSTGNANLGANIYPASSDPKFASMNLDSGYFTTLPQSRKLLFYYAPSANAEVIATDEATKETFTLGEILSGQPIQASQTYTSQIKIPLLLAVGQFDNFFCGTGSAIDCSHPDSIKSFESTYYTNVPSLDVFVLKNSGHDINLQNPREWFEKANSWIHYILH